VPGAVAREPDHKVPAEQVPFAVPAIRHLTTLTFQTPVTFFVGENGSGKASGPCTVSNSRRAPRFIQENLDSGL